ncbi:sodium:calcium antiporter [Fodinibius sp.]|uniref:sodium:calcium antiporter n=1 Tax=Fodinibius sp. TaxID=1872440 RepID=UPI002ACE4700|nr:sodium:calcium antiporter [Fodinibius sp.]MDZ7659765.1 sodium:calcium antiporter [Fodinibius sp.]
MIFPLIVFIAGLLIIVYFSEKLVEATVGTSLGFGISTFLISVVVIGFDPENLGLGVVASYEEVTGIAIGTIIGSAMVAVGLALGITALFVPMKFKEVPMQIPLIPVGAVLLFGILSFDGHLSRVDGAILLLGYVISVWYLIYLVRRGLDIRPTGEAAEVIEEGSDLSRWQSVTMLAGSLVAIIVGSEWVVWSSREIMAGLGLSETLFGMTIIALLVSIEEVARELPAALKGHPEITFGNVVGSVLAFFLCNAGIIALVNPVPISGEVFNFYLPISLGIVLFVTSLMIQKSIPRWAGALLVLGYLVFFGWGFW